MTIKALIVDDSALIREILSDILSSDPEIEVVGLAVDPFDARQKIKELNPDVITLDIEMPKMDGLSFLEKIMTLRPMPVLMISSLTQKGAKSTIKALELGAVDYIGKPADDSLNGGLKNLKHEITTKIKMAAQAKIRPLQKKSSPVLKVEKEQIRSDILIAIGASTGGVEALKEVLTRLPANMPPIVIVQHMPAKFTKSFAERMNSLCQMKVHEATDKQKIIKGNVYISPGGKHMQIEREAGHYVCKVEEGENVSGHCPSVDVLFESVAKNVKDKVIGVMLTGMGKDGAKGMLKMRKIGAINIGQDEKTSVVYGMPKEAKENGAVAIQTSLNKIAEEILKQCVSS